MENQSILKEFIDYLKIERSYSDNTIFSYEKDLKNFIKYYQKDISYARKNDIENYIISLKKLSSRSISHYLSSLKTFYNFLIIKNIITINPTINIERPKIKKKLPEYLTLEEVTLLLEIPLKNAYAARNKAILELLYSSGLRISELVEMQFSNLDIEMCIVKIMGKGNKERIVPLGDYAIIAIKDYLDNYYYKLNKKNSTYLFLNSRGDKISRQFIFKIIKLECQKKGIRKNVSPHTLRHTFATHLLKNGADLRIIQELLGHENLTTTQIYTHLSNDKLKSDYNDTFPRN